MAHRAWTVSAESAGTGTVIIGWQSHSSSGTVSGHTWTSGPICTGNGERPARSLGASAAHPASSRVMKAQR